MITSPTEHGHAAALARARGGRAAAAPPSVTLPREAAGSPVPGAACLFAACSPPLVHSGLHRRAYRRSATSCATANAATSTATAPRSPRAAVAGARIASAAIAAAPTTLAAATAATGERHEGLAARR